MINWIINTENVEDDCFTFNFIQMVNIMLHA